MAFAIDLHVHTFLSGDADADPEACVLRAIECGLHGIAFTEHYSYEASEPVERLKGKYADAILIVRGVEFSAAEGHCLVFGVNTDRLSMKYEPVQDLVRVVSAAGGVVIPSHPFRGTNSLGDLIGDIEGICAIEGCNGGNHHSFNARAIEAAGTIGLPYTGGSDAHAAREVGSCYTLFQEPVTEENLLDLLRVGAYQGVDTRKVSKFRFW